MISRLLVVALILLTSLPAQGQTEVRFELLPPGVLGAVDGVKYRLYTLEEWLKLSAFDAELVKLREDIEDYRSIAARYEAQLSEKDSQIATLKEDKDILMKRGLRLDEELNQCEKDKIDIAGGPVLPYVVGSLGAVIGVIGLTMWLTSY